MGGGKSRERRMHELGMKERDDKPGEREGVTGEQSRSTFLM